MTSLNYMQHIMHQLKGNAYLIAKLKFIDAVEKGDKTKVEIVCKNLSKLLKESKKTAV